MAKVLYTQKRRNQAEEIRTFDYTDKFGRSIGASVQTFEMSKEIHPKPEAWTCACDESEIGVVSYWYQPHALRNGKSYGAYHGGSGFPTAAERDAAVTKYFAQAEKRAAKIK